MVCRYRLDDRMQRLLERLQRGWLGNMAREPSFLPFAALLGVRDCAERQYRDTGIHGADRRQQLVAVHDRHTYRSGPHRSVHVQ